MSDYLKTKSKLIDNKMASMTDKSSLERYTKYALMGAVAAGAAETLRRWMATKKRLPLNIDFDGVVCTNEFPDMGEPQPGAQKALKVLIKTFYIRIYTCRVSNEWKNSDPKGQKKMIEAYMKEHDLPFDEVLMFDKPVGIIIDDNAYRYEEGMWPELVKTLTKS